jgi:hypothetical protein
MSSESDDILSMSDSRIDEAILSVAETRWKKVALIISRTSETSAGDLTEGDAERIAQRIEALVGKGRLLAQGNIKGWRFSELRLPD